MDREVGDAQQRVEHGQKLIEASLIDYKNKLEEISDKKQASSADISNPYGRSGRVTGILGVAPQRMDNGANFWGLTVSFDMSVNVFGSGAARLYGVHAKLFGKLSDYLTQSESGSYYRAKWSNGVSVYQDAQEIISGAPGNVSFSYTFNTVSCEDAVIILEKIAHERDLGYIELNPIIDNVEIKPQPERFEIEMAPWSPIYRCEDFVNTSRPGSSKVSGKSNESMAPSLANKAPQSGATISTKK